MLTILDSQMRAFDEAAVRGFEARLWAHLQECFADRCGELGSESVRQLIHHARERARSYGITTERGVFTIAELMMRLGPELESEPASAWVVEILEDTVLPTPEDRAELALDAVLDSLSE